MKFYLLSPYSVPMNQVLFPNMVDTFVSKGHEFVDRIDDCECILMDLHSRVADYVQMDIYWAIQSGLPIVTFDEWDRGNMSEDIWPEPLTQQQYEIFNHIRKGGCKSVHFCRLLDKTQTYPYEIHPYEKPLSYEEPMLTSDELFNREYDVCFIANISPTRLNIGVHLKGYDKLKSIISIGKPKIEFNDFVKKHKKAKLFISSGAGGYTDERKQCLFSVAGLIQENHNQLLLHPFTHMDNCLMINNPPTKEDLDNIYEVVNDKEKLYGIYQRNYEFMKKYYSKEYIANNILEIITKNYEKERAK